MKLSWVLLASLCLAGCAGAPQWTKQGVTPQVAASDYADCRRQAQAATRRDANIDADILASRGRDWQQSGTLSTHQTMFGATATRQQDDVVKACMIAKGYAPGG
ncbi:MAG TPA: hypothetical protein VMU87_00385 [Stellaceae bacterium]|nr:hypothetical protein [Stellaceae bacterium]